MTKSPGKFEGGMLGEGQGAKRFRTNTEESLERLDQEIKETPTPLSEEEARKILGKRLFFGSEEIVKVFRTALEYVPPIPFSGSELEKAKKNGEVLILQVDTLSGKPITLEFLRKRFGRVFEDQDWYTDKEFFKTQKPRLGWKLIAEQALPKSAFQDYAKQTNVLTERLLEHFSPGVPPPAYEAAIEEWRQKYPDIEKSIATGSNLNELTDSIANLGITKLTRETAVEVVYRFIARRMLSRNSSSVLPIWTGTLTRNVNNNGGDSFVKVTYTKFKLISISGTHPAFSADTGVCFSRMG